MDIREKVKKLPNSPGVYIFKDEKGSILYIGKALSLKKRASSYFLKSRKSSPRLMMLVEKIADIDFVTTPTEAEALILEAQLIKENKPRYNIELKDDKSYPLLKLTLSEDFPRIFMTRKIKDDGAVYFGRYTSSKLLKQALAMIRKLFPMRTCGKMPRQVCLTYHIGQCGGPCEKKIDREKYSQIVKDLVLFLEGKKEKLIQSMGKRMQEASEAKDYETAAAYRDRIKALSQQQAGTGEDKSAAVGLKELLGLPAAPFKIEAFDVSNIFGNWAVGSMVSFKDSQPDKAAYRRFKIESVSGINDYMMIRELIKRRYSGSLAQKLPMPDLVLIDGGKGHLNTALEEFKALGLSHVPVVSIAKQEELIFSPFVEKPLKLDPANDSLKLIQHIRDEAHRFAISYYRGLHTKALKESALDKIAGIGEKRKKDLIRHFGCVENIRTASFKDLLEVKSLNRAIAKKISIHFRKLDKLE